MQLQVFLQGEALWYQITSALLQQQNITCVPHAHDADVAVQQEAQTVYLQVEESRYGLSMPLSVDTLIKELQQITERLQSLTDKEKKLLQALQQAGNTGMTTAQLLQEVWNCRPDIDTHTVATHVNRLRKKLTQGKIVMNDNLYRWVV